MFILLPRLLAVQDLTLLDPSIVILQLRDQLREGVKETDPSAAVIAHRLHEPHIPPAVIRIVQSVLNGAVVGMLPDATVCYLEEFLALDEFKIQVMDRDGLVVLLRRVDLIEKLNEFREVFLEIVISHVVRERNRQEVEGLDIILLIK